MNTGNATSAIAELLVALCANISDLELALGTIMNGIEMKFRDFEGVEAVGSYIVRALSYEVRLKCSFILL